MVWQLGIEYQGHDIALSKIAVWKRVNLCKHRQHHNAASRRRRNCEFSSGEIVIDGGMPIGDSPPEGYEMKAIALVLQNAV